MLKSLFESVFSVLQMCLLPFLNPTILILACNLPTFGKQRAFRPAVDISMRDEHRLCSAALCLQLVKRYVHYNTV